MNTLDTIEAFIAETHVQLVTTEALCYSTSWSHYAGECTGKCSYAYAPNLYCVVP